MPRSLRSILIVAAVGLALLGLRQCRPGGDFAKWHRELRQPLLDSIAGLAKTTARVQAANAALLARPVYVDTIRLPASRRPTPPRVPPADSSTATWRAFAAELKQDLGEERELREKAEQEWGYYAGRTAELTDDLIASRNQLAETDSLVTEQAALLRQAEVVVRAAPLPRRAWLDVSIEGLALRGGGQLAAATVAIGPGTWQLIGRAETGSGTGDRLGVGVRRSIRLF